MERINWNIICESVLCLERKIIKLIAFNEPITRMLFQVFRTSRI